MNSRLKALIEGNSPDHITQLSNNDSDLLVAIDHALTELEHENKILNSKLNSSTRRLSAINHDIIRQYSYINEMLHINLPKDTSVTQLQAMQHLLIQYKNAVDSSLIISKTDIDGKITYVNDNFCKKSGYTELELIGKDHNILRHPDTKSSTYKKLWEIIKTKNIWQGILRNRKKDGSDYYVNPTIIPILNTKNEIVEFLAIRKDITEKIKSEEKLLFEQKKATTILNNQESIIVISNEKEGVIDVNKKFLELFNFKSLEEFKKKYKCVYSLFKEKDGYLKKDTSKNYWIDTLLESPDNIHKALILSGSNTERIFDIKSRKITFENKQLYLSTFTDITELENIREKAEDAQKAKSQFLANMSHEVRTPLNSLYGFLQLLEKTILSKEQRQYVEIAQSSMKILLGVVNDVLDFSKIESGKLEKNTTPCNPHKVFKTLFKSFLPMAEDKGIIYKLNIDLEINHCINIDELHITQVLQNLINNAIKFTDKDGSVHLDIKHITNKNSTQKLLFSVQDSGIGISKDKIDTIMQPFSQADSSTTRKFGGTGLGLSISKSLIELLGGELQVISQKGVGSTFFFEIDVNECIPNQNKYHIIDSVEEIELQDKSQKKLKILIAEDYEVNQMFMGILLDQYSNITYHFADNGEEVLTMLLDNYYDLIFMDINMPVMNGIDATKIIREKLKLDIPIIALTANALKGDREKFLDIGMNDYLSKPLEIKDMERILQKYS